eukprot:TRINITY_DN76699_c0_g1_i1.p1 TRINITY_DN76699_c0_g1~~TRINITY_DN76699_c0_g1_i1.p1  ORF type:complete len:360 (-),score=27.38 TRINITY_DN76699_c0_g1_i1:413-1411(-)
MNAVSNSPAALGVTEEKSVTRRGRWCVHQKPRSNCAACGRTRCIHGRQRCFCISCKGSQICKHLRRRAVCKECGGSQICQHGRRKDTCRDCFGSQICKHGRNKAFCKLCGGSQICVHGARRCVCKLCGGNQICQHNRRRETCAECGGSQVCIHGRQRYYCKQCGGLAICRHNSRKDRCKICLEKVESKHALAVNRPKKRSSTFPKAWKSLERSRTLRKRPAASTAARAFASAVKIHRQLDVSTKMELACKREPGLWNGSLIKVKQEPCLADVNLNALASLWQGKLRQGERSKTCKGRRPSGGGPGQAFGSRVARPLGEDVLGRKRVKAEQPG